MNYEPLDCLSETQTEDLIRMYRSEWWTRGRRPEDVQRMLEHADLVVGFCEPSTGRLAAFARVITDFVYKALVLDVIVAAEHRAAGLGRALMDRIVDHPRLSSVQHLELYCREEMIPFYERWGFRVDPDDTRFISARRSIARQDWAAR